jgi:hypothetical protein
MNTPAPHADSPFMKWPGQANPQRKQSTAPQSLRTKRERAAQRHDALCLVHTREAGSGLLYCHCVCAQCWDKLARKCICGLCRCYRVVTGVETHSAV